MFSARGSANFLTRVTAALAAVFMIMSLVLAILSRDSDEGASVMDTSTAPASQDSDALQPFESEDYDPDALVGGAAPIDPEPVVEEVEAGSEPAKPESAQQSGENKQPAVPSPD